MTQFIDTEAMQRAANTMAQATDEANRATSRIEEALRGFNSLFQDGYDSNALRLLALFQEGQQSPAMALLETLQALPASPVATTKPGTPANAVWLNYPEHKPAQGTIYLTNCGALYYDGVWLTPVEERGWEPDQHANVTRFLKCADQ